MGSSTLTGLIRRISARFRSPEFQPLYTAEELHSHYNSGVGLWIAVSGAAVLQLLLFIHMVIFFKLIGLI